MKLSEAFQLQEKEELIDFPGPLKTTSGRPPRFLYRVMNGAEWEKAQADGFLSPSQFYGRIHASIEPETRYGSGSVVVKIQYDQKDGWKAKGNIDGDVYAVTDNKIPLSKVKRV